MGDEFLDFDGAPAWTDGLDADQKRLYWIAPDEVVRHVDMARRSGIAGARNFILQERHFDGPGYRTMLRHVNIETGAVRMIADQPNDDFVSNLQAHEWVGDGEVYCADDAGRVYAYGPVERLVNRNAPGTYSHGEIDDLWFAVQEDGRARIHRIRDGVRTHFDVDGRITWMGEAAWTFETPDGAVIQTRLTDQGLWQHPTGRRVPVFRPIWFPDQQVLAVSTGLRTSFDAMVIDLDGNERELPSVTRPQRAGDLLVTSLQSQMHFIDPGTMQARLTLNASNFNWLSASDGLASARARRPENEEGALHILRIEGRDVQILWSIPYSTLVYSLSPNRRVIVTASSTDDWSAHDLDTGVTIDLAIDDRDFPLLWTDARRVLLPSGRELDVDTAQVRQCLGSGVHQCTRREGDRCVVLLHLEHHGQVRRYRRR